MSTIQPHRIPERTEFEKNREAFTEEQLAPYDRQWVAFSMDGKTVVAANADLLELDRLIQETGEDPQNVALEFIELHPLSWPGGVDFG